jgi:hypothetical protein
MSKAMLLSMALLAAAPAILVAAGAAVHLREERRFRLPGNAEPRQPLAPPGAFRRFGPSGDGEGPRRGGGS